MSGLEVYSIHQSGKREYFGSVANVLAALNDPGQHVTFVSWSMFGGDNGYMPFDQNSERAKSGKQIIVLPHPQYPQTVRRGKKMVRLMARASHMTVRWNGKKWVRG